MASLPARTFCDPAWCGTGRRCHELKAHGICMSTYSLWCNSTASSVRRVIMPFPIYPLYRHKTQHTPCRRAMGAKQRAHPELCSLHIPYNPLNTQKNIASTVLSPSSSYAPPRTSEVKIDLKANSKETTARDHRTLVNTKQPWCSSATRRCCQRTSR